MKAFAVQQLLKEAPLLSSVCTLLLIFIQSQAILAQEASHESNRALETISKALTSHEESLQSLRASGRYSQYRKNEKKEFELVTDASIDVAVEGDKYYVKLVYRRDWLKTTQRIIVFDGKTLGESRSSPNINPMGVKKRILNFKADGTGSVRPQVAEFPWDVAHLARRLSWFPGVKKNIPQDMLTCRQIDDSTIEMAYPLGTKSKSVVTCRARDGFHVSERQSISKEGKVSSELKATWSKIEGVWVVKTLSETQPNHDKSQLEFEKIEPNVKIDPLLFTLDALDLPSEVLLVD